MNIVLWILQAVLALLYFAGGAYKVFSFDEVAEQMVALSRTAWAVVGVFELLGAVLLIVPGATSWMPTLTPLAAAALALETLALTGLYASHSLELAATNPLLWSVVMAVLVAFVAYGRHSLQPLR
jgi:uncharacterized membrane protein YphA (DoxX/SURF4 family)